MRRFLPTAGASSASGTKPCKEPTCTIMALVGPVHQCPCGRWMHSFCGRGIGEEGYGGRPESCITSSITEAEVHTCFEEIRSYLYAKGRGGEYSETQYLLSKAVHSFTHETQVKRRVKERGRCRQLFVFYGRGRAFLAHNHCCCATKVLVVF